MLVLLDVDKREICWRTLVGLEHPFVQIHYLIITLCSFSNSRGGILSGILIFFKSYLPVIIPGLRPAAIYVFYENIIPVLHSKLFFFR